MEASRGKAWDSRKSPRNSACESRNCPLEYGRETPRFRLADWRGTYTDWEP